MEKHSLHKYFWAVLFFCGFVGGGGTNHHVFHLLHHPNMLSLITYVLILLREDTGLQLNVCTTVWGKIQYRTIRSTS